MSAPKIRPLFAFACSPTTGTGSLGARIPNRAAHCRVILPRRTSTAVVVVTPPLAIPIYSRHHYHPKSTTTTTRSNHHHHRYYSTVANIMATTTTTPEYELIYWPGIPGRGEHVRLALEEGGAAYRDTARSPGGESGTGVRQVTAQIADDNLGDDANAPPFAPPILRHGTDVLLWQTPAILAYLGPRLGLSPDGSRDGGDPAGAARVQALALTALDGLSNEVHDCHHPVGSNLYYEDQKEESLRKSKEFVANRLPKFLGYFERVLQGKASGDGPWLYGGRLTYADLVLFQCLDGTKFMFRKAIQWAEKSGKYARVFELYAAVKARPRIKEYLASDRRQDYSVGIYRYYPELDIGEEM